MGESVKNEMTLEEKFEKVIDDIVAKAPDLKTDDERKKYRKMFREILLEAKTPQQAMGIEDALMETIYAQGYKLFSSGKFKEASQIFHLLLTLNPIKGRYYHALASCFHHMKEYQNALEIYTQWAALDFHNPLPFYHAADCALKMNMASGAVLLLNLTIRRCGSQPEFKALKDRAEVLRDGLKPQAGWK